MSTRSASLSLALLAGSSFGLAACSDSAGDGQESRAQQARAVATILCAKTVGGVGYQVKLRRSDGAPADNLVTIVEGGQRKQYRLELGPNNRYFLNPSRNMSLATVKFSQFFLVRISDQGRGNFEMGCGEGVKPI